MPTQLVYRIGPNIWPELRSYDLQADIVCPKSDLNQLGILLADEETKAIRAFRLSACGSGPVYRITYEYVGFVPNFGRFGAIETVKPGTYAYEFTPKLADSVKGHWQEAVRVASHLQQPDEKLSRPMRIAAFRFCSSFDKGSPEDQLIDYSIALEALFTKENDAISYRLPLRAAIFVGDTPEEREKIFWTVKGSYDLRSDLAHGQSQLDQTIKVKNTKVDISEFMSDLRAIQFKALHRFSKASQKLSKENILRAIDTVAISLDRQPIERLYCPSRHDAQT